MTLRLHRQVPSKLMLVGQQPCGGVHYSGGREVRHIQGRLAAHVPLLCSVSLQWLQVFGSHGKGVRVVQAVCLSTASELDWAPC